MKRRQFLRASAVITVPLASNTSIAVSSKEDTQIPRTVAKHFFDELRSFENEEDRQKAAVGCANELCKGTQIVSGDSIESIVEGTQTGDRALLRVRRSIEILNEQGITTAVEPSMLERKERQVREMTKYIPLIKSFNNLRKSSCKVSPDNSESIEAFYYAVLAFGLEVALWHISAPYKLAWRGTRYVSNRTFLRFAKHGCSRCIAFAMSELHWAIRAGIYGDVIEESNIEFVVRKLHELDKVANKHDYDVDIPTDRETIETLLSDQQSGGESSDGLPVISEEEESGLLDKVLSNLPEIPDISFSFTIYLP